jgi:uncharacterized protein (TIGR03000 family)
MRPTARHLLLGIGVVCFGMAHSAQAGWHHHHRGGWGGGSGSNGSNGCQGGSAGGSSGGFGSSGGCSGGSSGGCSGGYGSSGNGAAANAQLTLPAGSKDALLTVWVPAEAQVVVNGFVTTTTGERRTYTVRNLPDGKFKYIVKANFLRDGLPALNSEMSVDLSPGSIEEIDLRGTPGIAGTVVFGPDAVARATVQLNGPKSRTAVTDDDGNFEFRELPPGQYELTVNGNAINVSRQAVQKVDLPEKLPAKTPLIVQVSLP